MRLPAVAIAFLMCAPARPADRAVTPSKGTVVGIIGVWKKDGKPLRFGNEVDVNSVVSAERAGSLTVGFSDAVATYSCEDACKRAVSASDKKVVQGWERLKAAVFPVIWKDADRLIAAVSRGTDVSEAVVPLKGDEVDLAAMLTDLAPGSYAARFKPLAPQGSPGPLTKFVFAHGYPALVAPAGVHPGLYDVELFRPDGQALGMEAWVLVSGMEKYASDVEGFKKAEQVVSKWSGNADARSVRAVLRAYLESMAGQ